MSAARARRHGLAGHPLYGTHKNMMRRCYSTGAKEYGDYGGRGIGVCEPWHDVCTFITDIERDLGQRPSGHSLDRIDNDGHYEPGNVRWADAATQNGNRRNSRAPGAHVARPRIKDLLAENEQLRRLLAEHRIEIPWQALPGAEVSRGLVTKR